MRALEAFQEAILMVDAADPECWTVLHVNKTFVDQTGMSHVIRSMKLIPHPYLWLKKQQCAVLAEGFGPKFHLKEGLKATPARAKA